MRSKMRLWHFVRASLAGQKGTGSTKVSKSTSSSLLDALKSLCRTFQHARRAGWLGAAVVDSLRSSSRGFPKEVNGHNVDFLWRLWSFLWSSPKDANDLQKVSSGWSSRLRVRADTKEVVRATRRVVRANGEKTSWTLNPRIVFGAF